MARKWWILGIAMSLVIGACGSGQPANEVSEEATPTTVDVDDTTAATGSTDATEVATGASPDDPIVLATSLPLTGEFAIGGAKHAEGYQFCVDEINDRGGLLGRPVELIVEDNRSDTEITVAQTERFINVDNVDVLLGTFSSLLGFPASSVAERYQMIYPLPSSGALRLYMRGYDYLFYFQQLPGELTGSSMVDLIDHYEEQGVVEERPTTAALVYADDFFAGAIAAGFRGDPPVEIPDTGEEVDLSPGFVEQMDMEIVFDQVWPIGFQDWLTLANSISSSGAEFLAVSTSSPDEAISLAQALDTVGYEASLAYFSQGTQNEFGEALGESASGIVHHSPWSATANFEGTLAGEPYSNDEFVSAFTDTYGQPPDEDEAIPFALCQGVSQVIEATGGTDNTALAEWMHDVPPDNPVRTIMGSYSWDERGLPDERSFLVHQWQDGQLEFVYPVGEFEGTQDLVFPKPSW